MFLNFLSRPLYWLIKKYNEFKLPKNRRHEAGFKPWLTFTQTNSGYEVRRWGRLIGCTVNTSAAKFKTLNKGDRCYILASGPSVGSLDLAKLKGQSIIAVNGTSLLLERYGLRALVYMITDSSFFKGRRSLVQKGFNYAQYFATTPQVLRQIIKGRLAIFDTIKVIFFEFVNQRLGYPKLNDPQALYLKSCNDKRHVLLPTQTSTYNNELGFSSALEAGVFSGRTVVGTALQLAYAMGFRRVYLLGVDMNVDQGTRFYENSKEALRCHLARDYDRVIGPFFEIVASMRGRHGFEVFNVSTNSRIPESVIPRVSFEHALAVS